MRQRTGRKKVDDGKEVKKVGGKELMIDNGCIWEAIRMQKLKPFFRQTNSPSCDVSRRGVKSASRALMFPCGMSLVSLKLVELLSNETMMATRRPFSQSSWTWIAFGGDT